MHDRSLRRTLGTTFLALAGAIAASTAALAFDDPAGGPDGERSRMMIGRVLGPDGPVVKLLAQQSVRIAEVLEEGPVRFWTRPGIDPLAYAEEKNGHWNALVSAERLVILPPPVPTVVLDRSFAEKQRDAAGVERTPGPTSDEVSVAAVEPTSPKAEAATPRRELTITVGKPAKSEAGESRKKRRAQARKSEAKKAEVRRAENVRRADRPVVRRVVKRVAPAAPKKEVGLMEKLFGAPIQLNANRSK